MDGDGARERGGGGPAATRRAQARRAHGLALLVLLLWRAEPAAAAAYDVEARSEALADTVAARNPDSGRSLTRRRLVQTLDLAGFEVVPGEDAGLSLQLRFDADFALADRELGALDGAARDRLQLLGGRLHWNGLLGGRLDLAGGRLTMADALGAWRLDGGQATFRPLPWLALTGFGGLQVTGASWMASPTLAPDGTRDSDRRRIAAGLPLYPCPAAPSRLCADETLDDQAPAFGARVATTRLPGGQAGGAELAWRRTQRAGSVLEEKLSAGARWRGGRLGADAAAEWDLYLRRLTALRAGLTWAAHRDLDLALEGLHVHPSFSADSIWSLFTTAPSREVRLRADWAPPGGPGRLWAAAGIRHLAAPAFSAADLPRQAGWEPSGALGGALAGTPGELLADLTVRAGPDGSQAWLSAVARRALRGWITVECRATLARIEDRVAPKNGGTFPALALLLSGRLERSARISLLLEDSAPRWARNDVRLFALAALGADWDTRMAR
ncbi:MAG: hypothetical protein HZB56_21590 [Deltaproteobacteria bacterium]|nr:hypothetical protein [Deltaproteobacteria bacterium]